MPGRNLQILHESIDNFSGGSFIFNLKHIIMKLTSAQTNLFAKVVLYMGINCPVKFDILKDLCAVRSFAASFNALWAKGLVERKGTNDFSNQFILTTNGQKLKVSFKK
jgi:hypothetical protein